MGTFYTAFLEAQIPLQAPRAGVVPDWICVGTFELGKAYELAWGGEWSAKLADLGADFSMQVAETGADETLALLIPGDEIDTAIAAALMELTPDAGERAIQYAALGGAALALGKVKAARRQTGRRGIPLARL